MIPKNPASNDNVLTIPPRVREEKESITPSNPKKIAITARTNPAMAPVVKLSTAATSAMIEGILNFAFVSVGFVSGASMAAHYLWTFGFAKHDHSRQLTSPAKYPIVTPVPCAGGVLVST
jgi:hypothetical protein